MNECCNFALHENLNKEIITVMIKKSWVVYVANYVCYTYEALDRNKFYKSIPSMTQFLHDTWIELIDQNNYQTSNI